MSTTQSTLLRTLQTTSVIVLLVFSSAHAVFAQDSSFTLTVAPPLFQLALQPGETWKSGIQVVNVNSYDITVFAEPVLFRPRGDGGQPEFYLPEGDTALSDTHNLAGWITVPQGAVTIASEQTSVVPITIHVPEDAPPGGHYAAILIGNRPPSGSVEGSALSVTSSVASLVFLRVAGDVVESGRVREFSTEQSIYENAEARFVLRFENQGNVHLRPQGDITIYNMFGKVRGYIPINQEHSGYGSVLPGSIRKYAFTWKSDTGSWDIGRYNAVATVGFGDTAKQFVNASVYFYVLPIIPLLQVIIGVGLLAYFIGWSLRAYIRRALYIEGLRQHTTSELTTTHVKAEPRLTLSTLIRPLQAGIVDLRSVSAKQTSVTQIKDKETAQSVYTDTDTRATVHAFLKEYKAFFAFIVIASVGLVVASAYFSDVLTYERTYEIIVEDIDEAMVPTPE